MRLYPLSVIKGGVQNNCRTFQMFYYETNMSKEDVCKLLCIMTLDIEFGADMVYRPYDRKVADQDALKDKMHKT